MRHNHCYSWQKLSGILWDSWPSCYVQRCHTMQCVTISFSLGWSKIQPGYVRTARISTGTSTAVQFTYCNTCEYWVVLNLHTANTFQFGTSTSIYTATQDSNSGNAKGMHHNTVWLILLSNPLFHVAMETADGIWSSEIHCFSVMSGHLSLPIVSTEYHTGTTESRHILLIVSYIDQFNLTLSNDVMMIPVCRKCRVSGLIVSFPARKIGGKIRLVTLCTILGTSMYFRRMSSGH